MLVGSTRPHADGCLVPEVGRSRYSRGRAGSRRGPTWRQLPEHSSFTVCFLAALPARLHFLAPCFMTESGP